MREGYDSTNRLLTCVEEVDYGAFTVHFSLLTAEGVLSYVQYSSIYTMKKDRLRWVGPGSYRLIGKKSKKTKAMKTEEWMTQHSSTEKIKRTKRLYVQYERKKSSQNIVLMRLTPLDQIGKLGEVSICFIHQRISMS
jgi:hypothetical protein